MSRETPWHAAALRRGWEPEGPVILLNFDIDFEYGKTGSCRYQ